MSVNQLNLRFADVGFRTSAESNCPPQEDGKAAAAVVWWCGGGGGKGVAYLVGIPADQLERRGAAGAVVDLVRCV